MTLLIYTLKEKLVNNGLENLIFIFLNFELLSSLPFADVLTEDAFLVNLNCQLQMLDLNSF